MKENKIRTARPEDVADFMRIKEQLPITMADGSTTTGGFLLGTNPDTYREYIDTAYCLVAECDGIVTGFGIMFPDTILRNTDLWQRRDEAHWNIELAPYESRKLCYFEQLAFMPGHRRMVIALAYHLVRKAFADGHEVLVTTTVQKPVLNLAAVPFIIASDGIKAGYIDEVYPGIGQICSDIYLIEANDFYARAQAHPMYSFLESYPVTDL